METMRPALKSGRDVWDKINLPESEFQQRLQRIRDEMVKEGIDVLLLYGRAPDHCGDLCYVSNFTVKLARFDAIIAIPQKDEVLLFCGGGGREFPEVRMGTWIEQLRGGNIPEECVKYLKEANLCRYYFHYILF